MGLINVHRFKNLISSFGFFIKGIVAKRSYDVIFYYPAHFERGHKGENQYFSNLYKICNNHNISYEVFVEPDFLTSKINTGQGRPFDFVFIIIILLRKAINEKKFTSFQHREWYIGQLIGKLFFRRTKFKSVIVLSNSMVGLFRGINQHAKIYDYQHGIIYPSHPGYFENRKVSKHILVNNVQLLLNGNKFYELVQSTNNYYCENAHVLGTSVVKKEVIKPFNRKLLFSLQIVERDNFRNKQILVFLLDFLKLNKNHFLTNGIEIIFKHHPRFENNIDVSCLLIDGVTSFSDKTLECLMDTCSVHLTFNSTTTFEAASFGIPTILIDNDIYSSQIFEENFEYPIPSQSVKDVGMTIKNYLDNSQNYFSDCSLVSEWFKKYYSPINEKLFVQLMRRNIGNIQ